MPALSPTMTHGNLTAWKKEVGDSLQPGDVLAEVETDKAQIDFEFQDEGYLAKILVPGSTKDVPVNKPIAVYVDDADDVSAFKDFKLDEQQTTTTTVKESETATTATEGEAKGEIQQDTVKKSVKTSSKDTTANANDKKRIIASPLAKLLALENGIALKNVTGTGPHGRIVKVDIVKYLSSEKQKSSEISTPSSATTKASTTTTSTTSTAPAFTTNSGGNDNYKDIEISQVRSIIAERLLQSTQTIPSYIVSSNISVSKLLKLRTSLNSQNSESLTTKISINDILMKAIAKAVSEVPDVNSYWLPNENCIRQFHNVDISVAVSTPNGLLTPIVKNVEQKGLLKISQEVKELAKRAKINKLLPNEFQGGTICISNLGMNHSVNSFTSIINPPQSSILAVGTIVKVPIEDAATEKGFVFDEQITITGTFDHRVVDGARAGEFMKSLKDIIENPLKLLL